MIACGGDVYRFNRSRYVTAAQYRQRLDAQGRPIPLIAETGGMNA